MEDLNRNHFRITPGTNNSSTNKENSWKNGTLVRVSSTTNKSSNTIATDEQADPKSNRNNDNAVLIPSSFTANTSQSSNVVFTVKHLPALSKSPFVEISEVRLENNNSFVVNNEEGSVIESTGAIKSLKTITTDTQTDSTENVPKEDAKSFESHSSRYIMRGNIADDSMLMSTNRANDSNEGDQPMDHSKT